MKFDKNGKFKILHLTDIHYVDGCEKDIKTAKLVKRLIATAEPDLIVVTGDTVYGEHNLEMIGEAFAPIVDSKIPWTFVLGNHDTEDGRGAEELGPAICELEGCMAFDDADISGYGNHTIDISTEDGEGCFRLILLDSGDYLNGNPEEGYDYIKPSQVEWYQKKTAELKRNYKNAGVMAFFHIPLIEYQQAWDSGRHVGELWEDVCASPVNSGLFDVMKQDGVTRGVFVGHDHINNFCAKLDGVILGYGRVAGYNTYSMEGYHPGGRVIELSADDMSTFSTYEILDDGRIIENAIHDL